MDVRFGLWDDNNYLVFLFTAFNIELLRRVIQDFPTDFRLEKYWKTLPIMVGSIEYRKGSLNVALSLNYLPKNFHLLLVEKPQPIIGIPYLKKVLKLNRNRIHYLGYLQKREYFSVLDKTDIYISASISEACQLAPLDALVMGKKVVATPAGAILDFFSLHYPFLIRTNQPLEIANLVLKASRTKKIKFLKGTFSLKSWKDIGNEIKEMYSKIIYPN